MSANPFHFYCLYQRLSHVAPASLNYGMAKFVAMRCRDRTQNLGHASEGSQPIESRIPDVASSHPNFTVQPGLELRAILP